MKGKWRNLGAGERRWAVCLAACLFLEIFFLPRLFYGFNSTDEMYFIGTVERMFRGDRVLIEEWHTAQQLCVFLIWPVYSLLKGILGSTEGIVVGVRMASLAIYLLISLICFWKVRNKGTGVLLSVFLFFIFLPFGIPALSYNSIQLFTLPLLLVCLYAEPHHKNREYVVYGVLLAVVVLANPFALSVYVLYGLICLAAFLCRKKYTIPEELRLRSFLLVSAGAAALAVLFAVFILSRGSLREVLENLPYILSDREHRQGLDLYRYKAWRYFYLCFKNYKYMFILLGASYLGILLDKNRYRHAAAYFLAGVCGTVPYLIYYGFIFQHIEVNYQMLPLTFLGLEAYFLTRNRDRRLFFCWMLPAMLYTVAVHYASNTGIVTISAAYGISSMAAVAMLYDFGREAAQAQGAVWKKRLTVTAVALALLAQFVGSLYLRMTFVWGDDKVWRLTARIEQGPGKGIYTIEGWKDAYETILEELDSLEMTPEDQLLVVGVAPWIYLYADAGCGSYSTWQVDENSVQLTDYYALHPDKFPTVVYMMSWGEDFLASPLGEMFLERDYTVAYLGGKIVLEAPGRRQEARENPS